MIRGDYDVVSFDEYIPFGALKSVCILCFFPRFFGFSNNTRKQDVFLNL